MPTPEDIEIAGKLAHEIGMQAHGTKDSERQWIAKAATHIERLLSGSAADDERAAALAHLHTIPAQGPGQ